MGVEISQMLIAVVPSIASALAAFFWAQVKLYQKKLSDAETRTKALEGGVRSLLRCRIIIIYNAAMKNKFFAKEEIGVLTEMFEEYCILNGNKQELEPLVNEILALPHFKHTDDTISHIT